VDDAILSAFPAQTYPLTVVSDPDDLLADDTVLAVLSERGFRLVQQDDPVLLRLRVEQERPWTRERPLVVVTRGQLREIPYDLWQPGHRVSLSLHEFFPLLSYPVVRTLSAGRRRRLSAAPSPGRTLGAQQTVDFVLRHAFGTDLDAMRTPAGLISWLNDYHACGDPLPADLRDRMLTRLRAVPTFREWPLDALLTDGRAFVQFLEAQWRGFLQAQTGHLLAETPVPYMLDFGNDQDLQDHIGRLVRSGTLTPVGVADPERLPAWARAGALGEDEDARSRRLTDLLATLTERANADASPAQWTDWQAVARDWAELHALGIAPTISLTPDQAARDRLQHWLDETFLQWLRGHYSPLGGQILPVPHHVHHIPHWLSYERRGGRADRVALLVLDGLSLADWRVIGSTWQARHADWRFQERLVLAQLPTITAISRQALVSGRRPADFADSIASNAKESELWRAFWKGQELYAAAVDYQRLAVDRSLPFVPPGNHIVALCLIESSIDELVHGASLGAEAVHASLKVWLEQHSPGVEDAIAQLLGVGFTVYLASDHGHVEARGIGQLSEGLAVETRGRRARTYRDRTLAKRAHRTYAPTVLWGDDGLLPSDLWALLAEGRGAFAPVGDVVVTHGGATIDEVIVPLVTIGKGND
jgi:hypothetical protein